MVNDVKCNSSILKLISVKIINVLMLLCFKLLLLSVHMHMWRKAIQNSRGNISQMHKKC